MDGKVTDLSGFKLKKEINDKVKFKKNNTLEQFKAAFYKWNRQEISIIAANILIKSIEDNTDLLHIFDFLLTFKKDSGDYNNAMLTMNIFMKLKKELSKGIMIKTKDNSPAIKSITSFIQGYVSDEVTAVLIDKDLYVYALEESIELIQDKLFTKNILSDKIVSIAKKKDHKGLNMLVIELNLNKR